MNFIMSIYDHNMVMRVKFCQNVLDNSWVIAFWVYHVSIGILGQVWYLIVSIPDLCTLTFKIEFSVVSHK